MADWDEESQQAPVITSHSSGNAWRQGSRESDGPSRSWSVGSYLWPFGRRRHPLAEQGENTQVVDDALNDTQPDSSSERAVEIWDSEPTASEPSDEQSVEHTQLEASSLFSASPDRPRLGRGGCSPGRSPTSSTQSTPRSSRGRLLNRVLLGNSPLRRDASREIRPAGGEASDSTPSTPLLSDVGDEIEDGGGEAYLFSAHAGEEGGEGEASTSRSTDHGTSQDGQASSLMGSGSGRLFCFAPVVSNYVQRLSSTVLRTSTSSMSVTGQQSNSGDSQVACLICLDPLSPEDFESGDAIQLECKCRGEAAMRHVSCARKWIKVKGDRMCDVCKSEIRNLPPPTPAASEADEEEVYRRHSVIWAYDEDYYEDRGPGVECVYTFLKIIWIVMIFCVLFFDLPFGKSVWIGVTVGVSYAVVSRVCILLAHCAVCAHNRRVQPAGRGGGPEEVAG